MVDINQVITLGVGTPAGIPEFLTFGLQIGDVVNPPQIPGAIKIGTRSTNWGALVRKAEPVRSKEVEYEFSNNRKFWTE